MDDQDDMWDDDEGDEMIPEPTRCLYCESTFPTPDVVFSHCRQEHGLDILHVHRIHSLDDYGYIKLINYIRKKQPPAGELVQRGSCPWSDDCFMKPEIEDDPLLQLDIEELDEMALDAGGDNDHVSGQENGAPAPGASASGDQTLVKRLRDAENRATQAELRLQQAIDDLAKMRLAAQDLVMSASTAPVPSHEAVQNLTEGDDDYYFDSYSHFSIHQQMLQDKVRTESYRDSMYKNKDFFKDKVVLDVGCGTGILSMFAARAGAKKVIGVDLSDVIYQAMDILRENGLEDRVTLIKGRMEDVDLPVEQVDIIISEWMGYCLLFESMLDSVLWARQRYLKEGGMVLPDHCTMTLVGLNDVQLHQKNVTYWEDVYGFKMNCMRGLVVREGSVQVAKSDTVITDNCVFKELDICSCSIKDLEFTSPVKLQASADGQITALLVYFDINFRLPNQVHFSTGPTHTPTHWKQTIFLLEKPLDVKKDQVLDGQFILRKNPKDPRGCKVTLSLAGTTTTYII